MGFKMQWDFLILFCMVFCQIWHRYFIWTFPAISEQENVILARARCYSRNRVAKTPGFSMRVNSLSGCAVVGLLGVLLLSFFMRFFLSFFAVIFTLN